MPDIAPTAERREQMLGLLAERALALACAVQQRALEAETSEEMAQLAQAFVRLSRSVRQSIALHAKLERDRIRGERETAEAVAEALAPAIARRMDQLERGVVANLCADWATDIDEDEGESSELIRSLHERLDDLSETENFLSLDPDQLIAQLCDDLAVEASRANAVLAPHKALAGTAPPHPSLAPTQPSFAPPHSRLAPHAKPNGHASIPPAADSS